MKANQYVDMTERFHQFSNMKSAHKPEPQKKATNIGIPGAEIDPVMVKITVK